MTNIVVPSGVVVPSGRALASLDPEVAEFLRQVAFALNDGLQGDDRIGRVATQADNIRTGAVAIDPVVDGVGSLRAALDATTENQNALSSETGGSGGLTATLSTQYLYGATQLNGSSTTDTVTVTPSGGSGNYSVVWSVALISDVTITGGDTATASFTTDMTGRQFQSGSATATITDTDDDSTVTRTVSLSFPTLYRVDVDLR